MIPISWWDLSNIPVWEYFNISPVQAHNELGFSVPNTIIIKTKRGNIFELFYVLSYEEKHFHQTMLLKIPQKEKRLEKGTLEPINP